MNSIYPREFLNSIEEGGMPPSALKVKKGVPLIVLRNLNIEDGLCNGTRCILLDSTRTQLKVRLITGEKRGQVHIIPRIKFHPSEKHLGFQMSSVIGSGLF